MGKKGRSGWRGQGRTGMWVDVPLLRTPPSHHAPRTPLHQRPEGPQPSRAAGMPTDCQGSPTPRRSPPIRSGLWRQRTEESLVSCSWRHPPDHLRLPPPTPPPPPPRWVAPVSPVWGNPPSPKSPAGCQSSCTDSSFIHRSQQIRYQFFKPQWLFVLFSTLSNYAPFDFPITPSDVRSSQDLPEREGQVKGENTWASAQTESSARSDYATQNAKHLLLRSALCIPLDRLVINLYRHAVSHHTPTHTYTHTRRHAYLSTEHIHTHLQCTHKQKCSTSAGFNTHRDIPMLSHFLLLSCQASAQPVWTSPLGCGMPKQHEPGLNTACEDMPHNKLFDYMDIRGTPLLLFLTSTTQFSFLNCANSSYAVCAQKPLVFNVRDTSKPQALTHRFYSRSTVWLMLNYNSLL